MSDDDASSSQKQEPFRLDLFGINPTPATPELTAARQAHYYRLAKLWDATWGEHLWVYKGKGLADLECLLEHVSVIAVMDTGASYARRLHAGVREGGDLVADMAIRFMRHEAAPVIRPVIQRCHTGHAVRSPQASSPTASLPPSPPLPGQRDAASAPEPDVPRDRSSEAWRHGFTGAEDELAG